MMSGGLVDKVYIGLDNAPAAFDIKGRILGPNGTNLEYIRSETGVVAVLKNDKIEPLHLALHHTRSEALAAARSLAQNLIETIRAELAQWSAAQAGGPPPALNVPPPTLATSVANSAPPPVPPPVATVSVSTPPTITSSAQQTILPPVVSVAPASTPLMTVRQPTVLQLLPQQQYVLNQENGQLIPIVQPGVQVANTNFTSLPIAQQLGLQQPNFGTQIVDISNMQPVNVTQLRLSGVPSSMSMILPNGLSFPQASLANTETTTVSSATMTPVVCAAQNTNASQKILYSTDNKGDKEVKYHIQGADTVQWTMPNSQTMLIPYQQLQDLTANQQQLTNIQPQQFVSIAPAGGLQQTTSLPLTAAQLQQLQATGTIMHLNQKPIVSSGSLINIISTGQASSPQIISNAVTPTKNVNNQESRGQKRLSDGSPSQLQLRPIAPAGSNVQDKTTRDSRTWTTAAAGRENTIVSMGMKINPAQGTIIHVSSGQQTNVSATGVTQDGTGMYIRQIDRSALQIQSKEQKPDAAKQNQNVQMITVPGGVTVLQGGGTAATVLQGGNTGATVLQGGATGTTVLQGNGAPVALPAPPVYMVGGGALAGGGLAVLQGGLQYGVPLVQAPPYALPTLPTQTPEEEQTYTLPETNYTQEATTYAPPAQQTYAANGAPQYTAPTPQPTPQQAFSPAPANYQSPPPPNPYPNATGQNLAAYASNQYQYTSRPWFRPRYNPQAAYAPAPPAQVPPAPYYNYWQDS